MNPTRKVGVATLATTMALGLPAVSFAQNHERAGHDRGVPSRIAGKVRAAERALDRAQERADDGNTDGAIAQLSAVRKNLASALKSAKKRIVADSETGRPSASALAKVDDHVVDGTVAILDGAPDTLVAADVETLKAALDNRDAVIAAIAALGTENQAEYSRVLSKIVNDAADEAEDINEALTDDTLTDAAKAALNDALTQLNATATAAKALVASDTSDATGYENADYESGADRGDCPRGGGQGGRPQGDGTGYEDQGSPGSYGV